MLALYENIKRLRVENGFTQDELAKRLGYTDRSIVAKIERGAVDLSTSRIIAFAEALGVTPSFLMGWSDDTRATRDASDALSDAERDHIRKYRALDDDGRQMVDTVLDTAYWQVTRVDTARESA